MKNIKIKINRFFKSSLKYKGNPPGQLRSRGFCTFVDINIQYRRLSRT